MNREEKVASVTELQARFRRASVTLVAASKGLTVAKTRELRRALRQAGGELKVAKNTLARRALKDTAFAVLEELLTGPTGLVFGYDDPIAVAKVLVRFTEENAKLSITGGALEGRLLPGTAVTELAKLPSREVLLGMLLGLLQAPATQLLRTIQEPGARFARLLGKVRDSREQQD